jgi:putative tricarboxylic transport membrane protein|tara:strand:- start:90445 stop:90894 length:450 start_codon:yes stop_codon:yes gene_type:complete
MKRADAISGGVLFAFAAVMLFFIIPSQIETGPSGMVSPRLVPNIMMVALAGLSALLVWKSAANVNADDTAGDPVISRAELWAALKLSLVFAGAIVSFLWGSALIAGVVLVSGSLLALGERRIWVLILMPAALMFFLWLVFYKLLGTAII